MRIKFTVEERKYDATNLGSGEIFCAPYDFR